MTLASVGHNLPGPEVRKWITVTDANSLRNEATDRYKTRHLRLTRVLQTMAGEQGGEQELNARTL